MDVSLEVVPPPAFSKGPTVAVLIGPDDAPDDFVFFTGDGDVNLLCGGCGRVLAAKLENALVIQGGGHLVCPSCRAHNATRS